MTEDTKINRFRRMELLLLKITGVDYLKKKYRSWKTRQRAINPDTRDSKLLKYQDLKQIDNLNAESCSIYSFYNNCSVSSIETCTIGALSDVEMMESLLLGIKN